MLNPIKTVYQWNLQAGLLDAGYDERKESAFPIEEALENFDTNNLYLLLSENCNLNVQENSPKYLSRAIISALGEPSSEQSSVVNKIDKHVDSIIYNLGSLFKIGLNPQQATEALNIVMQANMQKLTAGKDSEGKQLKPHNFIPPEEELQKLVNKIGL